MLLEIPAFQKKETVARVRVYRDFAEEMCRIHSDPKLTALLLRLQKELALIEEIEDTIDFPFYRGDIIANL